MAKTGSSPQRLQQLIAERQRYEEWLVALAARRASTPANVYERVEADYQGRITRIREELAARAGEVRERITGLMDRIAAMQAEEAQHRDARTEGELRTAVGEYTAEQWSALSAETEKQLASLAAQRATIEADLAELRQILAQSAGEAPRPREQAATTPAPQRQAPVPPATLAAPPPAVPPATVAPPAPAPKRERRTPARGVVTGQPSASAEPQSASQALAQKKTLKCAECGTFNYPTEWYCESCGAELAAL